MENDLRAKLPSRRSLLVELPMAARTIVTPLVLAARAARESAFGDLWRQTKGTGLHPAMSRKQLFKIDITTSP